MLKELRIRNLAIIEDLAIRFGEGLNVLTGETGAGKSIIVDALGLALGSRAQSDMIKSGEKEASVEAFFEMDDAKSLPDIGIDITDGILLRRVISSSGKSRAYINDSMVTLQTMALVGNSVVDIHSQHEHQSLMSPERQRDILDSYGKLHPERENVKNLYDSAKTLREEHERIMGSSRTSAHRLDLLKYQISEIDSAELKPGEKESLIEERQILANAGKLHELVESAYALLYEADGSCSEDLSRVIAHLREVNSVDSGIGETLNMLESAVPLIKDASFALGGFRERYTVEPGRLDAVEDRLDLISRLEKKYGSGINAILAYREDAISETNSIENSDERLAKISEELSKTEEELNKAATSLSDKRKKTADEVDRLVSKSLQELALPHASFKIDVRQESLGDGSLRVHQSGCDKVEFLFSANPGEPPKPLSKIISGGELSRVMLALKSILADVDNIPVLIFDEVDAGIGGKTAESVAKKLEAISKRHQLLCITHLPQIASSGDYHFRIEKKSTGKKVDVEVKELHGVERKNEIARMLSGNITEISVRHAGELLSRSG